MLRIDCEEPLYQQLYSHLRKIIVSGKLGPGQKLPSERQLALEHGISRGTARKAIQLLIEQGYAQSRPGSGTRVIRRH